MFLVERPHFAYFQNSHTDKEKVISSGTSTALGATPMPCQVLGAAGKIMTERACTTKKAAARMVHFTWEKVAKRINDLIQKGRYLTEQEQEEFDKIQAEKALAEEDALQAQPPDTEPADVLREGCAGARHSHPPGAA